MKQLNRFPRWLRVMLLAIFVAGCIAINAIAFSEIAQAPQVRRFFTNTFNPSPTLTAQSSTSDPSNIAPATTQPAIQPNLESPPSPTTPAIEAQISPNATLEEAKAKRDGTSIPKTLSTTGLKPDLAAQPVLNPTPPALNPTPKYGHFPYLEGSPDDMLIVAGYGAGDTQRYESLHPDAAAALFKMISAARADGIWLVAASGFRTLAQQRTLFTEQVAKQGSAKAAARISAPPGYSEHHTGHAVDLTDGSLDRGDDISLSFAETAAYRWLTDNGIKFGFELSFPEDNAQGISYEPWHWRFVGTTEAKALFSQTPKPTADTTGKEPL